jgi:hypothetical protein
MAKDKPTHKKCRGCGEWFSLGKYERPTRKFCSVSCFATWRNAQPKWKTAHSGKIKAQTDPETMREKSRAAWRDPATRAKMIAIRRAPAIAEKSRVKMQKINKKIWADPEFRKRHVERSKKTAKELWRDPIFRIKTSAGMAEINKQRWADPDYKEATSRSIRIALAQPLQRKRLSRQASERAQKPEAREQMRTVMRERWRDPEYRSRMSKKISERRRRAAATARKAGKTNIQKR